MRTQDHMHINKHVCVCSSVCVSVCFLWAMEKTYPTAMGEK